MKICSKCNQEKNLDQFYKSKTCKDGYTIICKKCFLKRHYTPTPNKKLCKECKLPLTIENGLNSGHKRKNGSIIFANRCKTCIKSFRNKWAKNRRSKIDIKLYESIKVCINTNLKKETSISTIEHLGCNIKEYKQYLEQQFTPEINWDNYGTYWEIDHIYPLSKGGSFHYTNTRPLSIYENRVKYNKIQKL
jgi:hypothetical protein